MPAIRKIIHIDMDCYYAAIEVRERPELRGRPVAVAGSSRRGVLTTCSYEAREFGCRSAMPTWKARELCPDLVVVPVRFDLYREVSRQIRGIMLDYTKRVEPLSLDEAFLDVTGAERYAWDLAREIRARIAAETGLTASAGIASNKMLAKIASDWRKPNGQFAVTPDTSEAFMESLPVKKIWGVGPKAVERLAAHGVATCGDLQRFSRIEMGTRFGRFGEELYNLCRGIDERPVEPRRIRKSLSNEHTFEENLTTLDACREALRPLFAELTEELAAKARDRIIAKAVVKLKFADFRVTTKECVCAQPEWSIYAGLLEEAHGRSDQPVRLIGAGVRFAEARNEDAGQLELDFSPVGDSDPDPATSEKDSKGAAP